MSERSAAEEAARAEALALVNEHAAWASGGPWLASTAALLAALSRLAATQPRFVPVDAALPFADRAARLVAWCASHPHYSSAPLALCCSLPGKPPGTRGVTAAAPLAAGAPIVCVPAALALSTDSAYLSWELGPLLDQPKLGLAAMASVVLGLHLLVEHAKAALTPLPEGEGALGVPLPASAPTGRPAATIAEDVAACAALGPEGLLTTRLRPEAHPWGSPWRAFLACLPERVPNCMFWGARHFARLAHTRVGYMAARFLRDNAKVYLTLSGSLAMAVEGLSPHFTWEAFRWAQACCMSRQNQLPSLPGTPRPAQRAAATTCMALLPIFDMLNHDPREAMPYFTALPAPGVVTACLTTGAAAAGAELSMNYGPRAAGELLMHQGFLTPPSLAVDAALLTLTPPRAFSSAGDAIFAIKTGLLEKLGIHWSRQGITHLAALAQSRGEPPQVTAGRLKEDAKWALPLDFPLRRGGGGGCLPAQAWTLARVLCLEKRDAVVALRAAQEACRRVEEEVREREAAAAAAALAAPVAGACCGGEEGEEAAAGGGHSHGAGAGAAAAAAAAQGQHSHDGGATQCSSSHGHGHGAASASAAALRAHSHDGGATQCKSAHGHGSGALAAAGHLRLGLPVLSADNERAARAFLAQHLRALHAVAQGELAAAAAEAGSAAAQPGSELAAEDVFVAAYLESQAAIIAEALAEVEG